MKGERGGGEGERGGGEGRDGERGGDGWPVYLVS